MWKQVAGTICEKYYFNKTKEEEKIGQADLGRGGGRGGGNLSETSIATNDRSLTSVHRIKYLHMYATCAKKVTELQEVNKSINIMR